MKRKQTVETTEMETTQKDQKNNTDHIDNMMKDDKILLFEDSIYGHPIWDKILSVYIYIKISKQNKS